MFTVETPANQSTRLQRDIITDATFVGESRIFVAAPNLEAPFLILLELFRMLDPFASFSTLLIPEPWP
jgi:hypothetical protein